MELFLLPTEYGETQPKLHTYPLGWLPPHLFLSSKKPWIKWTWAKHLAMMVSPQKCYGGPPDYSISSCHRGSRTLGQYSHGSPRRHRKRLAPGMATSKAVVSHMIRKWWPWVTTRMMFSSCLLGFAFSALYFWRLTFDACWFVLCPCATNSSWHRSQ